MSEVVDDPSTWETPETPDEIYLRGHIVCVRNTNEPEPKKLWIWEMKRDTCRNEIWYLLKDGPGEKAKDMGWFKEEGLDSYREEEPCLLDL